MRKSAFIGGIMENELYEKRGYLLEDFRLFHLRGAQGVKADFHYHEFCKLLLLISGSGGYWAEGRHYTLSPGDVVLLGSRCVHKPEFAADAPYERVIVYISPEFLQRSSTSDCDLLEIFSGQFSHVYRPSSATGQKLAALVAALERELSGQDYGRILLSSGMLLRILVSIGRDLRKGGGIPAEPSPIADPRVHQIQSYIDAHLEEDLTVDQIAEAAFLSKFHMMRLFRAHTGMSIHQYVSQQRLVTARDMIRRGIAATDAAFRCGFGSYSSFTRAYAKHFGTTPTGRQTAARLEETFE